MTTSEHPRSAASAQSAAALVREATATLSRAGCPSPRVDSEHLLAHVSGRALGELRLAVALGEPVSAETAREFHRLVEQRAQRVPLQHLTGTAAFRHLELAVGPGVFTPRPETEILVDLALEHLPEAATVMDWCAGSGAIGCAIAYETEATVTMVEKDETAVAWTRRNRDRLPERVRARTSVIHADIRDLPQLLPDIRVDAIVTNPPYVPSAMVLRDPEVAEWDPPLALYSGADGLDLMRELVPLARRMLRPGGRVWIEHAEHQGAAVCRLLRDAGFADAATFPDLTGRDRVSGGSLAGAQ